MRNHRYLNSNYLTTVVASIMLVAAGSAIGAAPVAKVTAIVRNVRYRTGNATAWHDCRVGTQLGSGARVRTDRRSKCEIKFPGGSIVRMAPRSDLAITSVKANKLSLLSGRALAHAVGGSGVQIKGTKATVGIQGTWVLFDGQELSVWDGTATLSSQGTSTNVGHRQNVIMTTYRTPLRDPTGKKLGTVTAKVANGTLIVTYQARKGWGLTGTHLYVGPGVEQADTPDTFPYRHEELHRTSTDTFSIPVSDLQFGPDGSLQIIPHATLLPTFKESADPSAWGGDQLLGTGNGMFFSFNPFGTNPAFPFNFATGNMFPWWSALFTGVNTQSTPTTPIGQGITNRQVSSNTGSQSTLFNPPQVGDMDVEVQSTQPATGGRGGSASLSTAALMAALSAASQPEGAATFGKRFFGPYTSADLLTIGYEGGTLSGGRVRTRAIHDNFYFELGGLLSSRYDGEFDSDISEAFVLWRQDDTDITAGRQHYLRGPAQNMSLGSLFSYLTFDGVTIHHQSPRLTLDLAWVDSYEHNLTAPGEGTGWLARATAPLRTGQIGATAFRENGADTGYSFDISYPVLPDKLDLYGEIGEDPWGNELEMYGLYLPGLYEAENIDLFIEYAHRDTYESVWSARAYQELDRDWTILYGARKTSGQDPEFALGALKRFGKTER